MQARSNARGLALALLTLVGVPAAQQAPALSAGRVLANATGIARVGNDLLGVGPGYKVRFDPAAVTVSVPGERITSLHFELSSVQRASGDPARLQPPILRVEDTSVEYDRGSVIERYDLGQGGVEQSFVLPTLPRGSGDLIVRGQLTSTVSPVINTPELLQFGDAATGAVRVGAVVGLDAAGQRRTGTLRLAGTDLELVLPAAFVDSAVFPLVVDPLIGPLSVTSHAAQDADFDLAYNQKHDIYLLAWTRDFGADQDILGQRLLPDGTRVGNVLPIETSTAFTSGPRVANIRGSDAFVVGYLGGLRAISAATGTMSTPDTGLVWEMVGDARPNGDVAIAVEAPSTGVKAWQLQVAPGGTATTAIRNVTLSNGPAEPHGPSHGGAAGRYLIVWHEGSGAATEIRGAIIDSDLNVLQSSFSIAAAGNWRHDAFVDGDGDRWVVSYEMGPTNNQLACRTVAWNNAAGTAIASPEVTVLNTPNRVDLDGVAWSGESYVLAYRRVYDKQSVFGTQNTVPLYNAYLGSIDPFSCLDCEGEILVQPQVLNTTHGSIVFASQHSGSTGGGAGGLAVWQTVAHPGIWFLTGRWTYLSPFRALDGIVTDIGGGCGTGGQAFGSCAIVGNTAFDHRLENATPNVPALLLLGSRTLGFPCGPCSLVTDPTTSYLAASVTNAQGAAEARTPIPPSSSLVGASLVDQWLTLTPQPACNLFSTDFSNAIRITIE